MGIGQLQYVGSPSHYKLAVYSKPYAGLNIQQPSIYKLN